MRTSLLATAVCVVALGLLAAGCGGGSSPEPLSAAAWRRSVNVLCRGTGHEASKTKRPRSTAEITPFVAAVLPLWKKQADGVRALVPPPELATLAGKYVQALDYVNAQLLDLQIAAQRDDAARGYRAVRGGQLAVKDAKRAARALRLPACARQRIP